MYDMMLFVVSFYNAYGYLDIFVNVHWVTNVESLHLWRFLKYWKDSVSERERIVIKLTPLLNKFLNLPHHKFLFQHMLFCLDSQSPELCVLSRACRLQVYFLQRLSTLVVVLESERNFRVIPWSLLSMCCWLQVLLYDLRSSTPILTKDHMYVLEDVWTNASCVNSWFCVNFSQFY